MNAITQNTKITSTDINTLISECNNKLSLSGGVLTGRIDLKDTNHALGELTEDTWHTSPLQFYDKNNKRIGLVQTALRANGHSFIRIQAENGLDSIGFLEIQSNGMTINNGHFHNFGLIEARTSAAGIVVGPENKQSCIIWNNGDYTMISPSRTDNRYSEGFRSIQIRNSDGYLTELKTINITTGSGTTQAAIRYLDSTNLNGGQLWLFPRNDSYWKGGVLLRSIRGDDTIGGELSLYADWKLKTNTEIISTGVEHNPAQFRAVNGNYGFMIRNDGESTWFLLTANGDPEGTWTDDGGHPMRIVNETHDVHFPQGAYLGQGKIWIA